MVKIQELIDWLQQHDPKNEVGIDEGGLTLHIVQDNKILTDDWYEIGGIPAWIENDCQHIQSAVRDNELMCLDCGASRDIEEEE